MRAAFVDMGSLDLVLCVVKDFSSMSGVSIYFCWKIGYIDVVLR